MIKTSSRNIFMLISQWKQWEENILINLGFNKNFFPLSVLEGEIDMSRSSHSDVDFLGTCGTIPSHTDKAWPPYSYHLVLRNQRLLAKGLGQNKKKIPTQTPGTIVELNVHESHHLIYDTRLKVPGQEPVWLSACYDSYSRLDKTTVNGIFREFLSNYGLK